MIAIIAHRGAWAETGLPEQTRAAFEAAFDLGADGVECDVRLTADGVVVCHHDATVKRLTGDPRSVHELTLAELRALEWGEASGGAVTLAELADIASAAGRPVVLAIELKHPNPDGTRLEEAVLEALTSAGWDAGTAMLGAVTVSLMTFNPASLPTLLPVVAAEHIVLLTAEAALDDISYAVDTTEADNAARAALEAELAGALALGRSLIDSRAVGGAGPELDLVRREPDAVRGWVAAGQTVRVWTVDTTEDAEACAALGVTQIETDRPRALLAWRNEREES